MTSRREELDLADAAIKRLATQQRMDRVRELQQPMRWLYMARARSENGAAYVSADDARGWLTRHQRDLEGPHHWITLVFRQPGWQAIPNKWHISETPGSHGNRLRAYRWVGA